jgi:hypothetical protein
MRFILKTLLYVFYVLFTLDARNRYLVGKAKGKHCWKITSGVGSFTNHYENREPVREYLTWIEFRKTLPHLEKVGKANKSTTLQGVITFFMISSVVALGIILTVIAINQ